MQETGLKNNQKYHKRTRSQLYTLPGAAVECELRRSWSKTVRRAGACKIFKYASELQGDFLFKV